MFGEDERKMPWVMNIPKERKLEMFLLGLLKMLKEVRLWTSYKSPMLPIGTELENGNSQNIENYI